MNAIIIAIGDELTSGKTVDTNSAYLSSQIALFGIETTAHRTIGDCESAIADALKQSAALADIVLVTGGLGPTRDDLTRQALADAMGCELKLDEKCLAKIEAFFRQRDWKMNPSNRIQAMIPTGAKPLDNLHGTAPGIEAELDGAKVFIMPGVPREMHWMFEHAVKPHLPQTGRTIIARVVHTFGVGESDIAAMVADLMDDRHGNTVVGITVAEGLVSLRISVRADSAASAGKKADELVTEIRKRLGTLVIGQDEQSIASVVGDLLREKKMTLATAESCTGGMIGEMITSVPGASDYYLGGVSAYANEIKRDFLGVAEETLARHGAVSQAIAKAMAIRCREKFSSDWAISVTGTAGPGGGTEETPVGLVYIGIAGPNGCKAHKHIFTSTRQHIRRRTTTAALNHLRLVISNQ